MRLTASLAQCRARRGARLKGLLTRPRAAWEAERCGEHARRQEESLVVCATVRKKEKQKRDYCGPGLGPTH